MNERKGFQEKILKIFLRDKGHMGILIMDIVIAMLCVILVLALWFTGARFWEEGQIAYDESSFYYSMDSGNYDNLLRMSLSNRVQGKKGGAAYQEYYAVADYFEAALYYNIYVKAEDESRAKIWEEEMEDAVSRMGDLSAQQQKIDKMLETK